MPPTMQEYQELKDVLEAARRDLSRLAGRRDSLLERLQADFSVTTEAEARRLLKSLRKQVASLEAEYAEKLGAAEEVLNRVRETNES